MAESFLAWKVIRYIIDEGKVVLEMVMDIGFPSEAWCALTKIAAGTQERTAYERAKSEFKSLEIGVSETVAEYFARVNDVLTNLTNTK